MIFFIADMHFFHHNLIKNKERFGKHCRNQFKNTNEMNNLIIKNWKEKITNEDEVYILGDIDYGNSTASAEIISNLPGKKILLMGNHDVEKIKVKKHFKTPSLTIENLKYPIELFQRIYPGNKDLDITYNGLTFRLNHFPPCLSIENHIPKHFVYLHAHSHSLKAYNMANMGLHIPVYDVGVDANDFSPISVEELIERMKLWTMPNNIKCNKCGSFMKIRNGNNGLFLGCNNYPNCKNTYSPIHIYG